MSCFHRSIAWSVLVSQDCRCLIEARVGNGKGSFRRQERETSRAKQERNEMAGTIMPLAYRRAFSSRSPSSKRSLGRLGQRCWIEPRRMLALSSVLDGGVGQTSHTLAAASGQAVTPLAPVPSAVSKRSGSVGIGVSSTTPRRAVLEVVVGSRWGGLWGHPSPQAPPQTRSWFGQGHETRLKRQGLALVPRPREQAMRHWLVVFQGAAFAHGYALRGRLPPPIRCAGYLRGSGRRTLPL